MTGIPDLSPKGWVTDPVEKADKLMAHFYAAEYSQTNLFPNDVSSFTYLLQNNLGDEKGLEDALSNELKKYFSKYFDNVSTYVKVHDDPDSGSKQTVEFSISFSQNGKQYDLLKTKELSESLYERYYKLNNTGVLDE
jgi:hypothetical protein